MNSDSLSTTNYAAVIGDLRAKREELDRMIAMLEILMQDAARKTAGSAGTKALLPHGPDKKSRSTLSIGEACVSVLRQKPFPMTNRQVTDILIASGYRINSADPVNNVGAALYHRAKSVGDVEKVGRQWRFGGGREKSTGPMATIENAQNGIAPHWENCP